MVEKHKIAEGYKQTEVGVIPEDWEVDNLSNVAHLATGMTPPTNDQSNYGDEFLFVGPGDLGKTKWILKTSKNLTAKGFAISRKFPANSVLVTCIGSTIGKSGMSNIELTSNQQINAIFPNDDFNSEFVYYQILLNSKKLRGSAGEQAVPLLNKNKFGEFQIPLPSTRAEQTAIATALSDMDALMEGLEKLLVKKRNIKQGAMQELLKPKEAWGVKKLEELADFFKGKGLPKKNTNIDGNVKCIHYGELFLQYGDIINKIKNRTNKFEGAFFSKQNDVLMPTSDVTPYGLATSSCIKENNVLLGGDILIIRFINHMIDGSFFSFYIKNNKNEVMKLVKGVTVYHLHASDMKDFCFSYPNIEEQIRIAQILSDMDTEIEKLETQLSKYKMIKTGMMQELLTGKKRLI